jgi:hypothetical protein
MAAVVLYKCNIVDVTCRYSRYTQCRGFRSYELTDTYELIIMLETRDLRSDCEI